MKQKTPNFFIVGAQKCGTTSMYNYLKQHPEIYMSPIKEPGYYAQDILSPKIFISNLKNYQKLFEKASNEKVIGDATTSYLNSKVAAKKIKDASPNAKILIMLRSPVDMIYSLYNHRKARLIEKASDFKEALSLEKVRKRKPIKLNQQNSFEVDGAYRYSVEYYSKVKKYIDLFCKKNVKIIILENFKKNPKERFKEILKFLEVDPFFKADFNKIHNEAKGEPRSKIIIRFYNLFVERCPISIKNWLRTIIPSFFIDRFLLKSSNKKNGLDKNLRKKLIAEILPEIKKLEKLIKKNLTSWKK